MDELLITSYLSSTCTSCPWQNLLSRVVGEQVLLFLTLNHRRVRFSWATKGDQVYTVVWGCQEWIECQCMYVRTYVRTYSQTKKCTTFNSTMHVFQMTLPDAFWAVWSEIFFHNILGISIFLRYKEKIWLNTAQKASIWQSHLKNMHSSIKVVHFLVWLYVRLHACLRPSWVICRVYFLYDFWLIWKKKKGNNDPLFQIH